MKKKNDRIKEWIKNHETEIIKFGYYIVGFGLGCLITRNIDDLRFGAGLVRLNNKGSVKFFNPESGVEITIDEWSKILEK